MDRRSARHGFVGARHAADTILEPVPRSTVTPGSGAHASAPTGSQIANHVHHEDAHAARRTASARRLTPPPSPD